MVTRGRGGGEKRDEGEGREETGREEALEGRREEGRGGSQGRDREGRGTKTG